jgi:hypothetical protein
VIERLHLVVSGTRERDSRLEFLVPHYIHVEVPAKFGVLPWCIYVGCARGVDEIVRQSFPCVVHTARWDELGKRAGMVRNEEMLDAALANVAADVEHDIASRAVLLAFPRDGGRGTQGCIQSAIKRRMCVWEVPRGEQWSRIHKL